MVEALFNTGHNDVVLDACNHTVERRKQWESPNWVQQFHIIQTPADVCIQRAKDCNYEHLVPVITRMASQWNPPGMEGDC